MFFIGIFYKHLQIAREEKSMVVDLTSSFVRRTLSSGTSRLMTTVIPLYPWSSNMAFAWHRFACVNVIIIIHNITPWFLPQPILVAMVVRNSSRFRCNFGPGISSQACEHLDSKAIYICPQLPDVRGTCALKVFWVFFYKLINLARYNEFDALLYIVDVLIY